MDRDTKDAIETIAFVMAFLAICGFALYGWVIRPDTQSHQFCADHIGYEYDYWNASTWEWSYEYLNKTHSLCCNDFEDISHDGFYTSEKRCKIFERDDKNDGST